jgi:NADH:ubiquinone oxidoreductase subunit 2 (subunit N)
MTSLKEIFEKYVQEIILHKFLHFQSRFLFDFASGINMLVTYPEVLFLLFSVFILSKIFYYSNFTNLFLLRGFIITILILRVFKLNATNLIFHNFLNTNCILGFWEISCVVFFLLLTLILLDSLILKYNLFTLFFLSIFLYSSSSIFYVNNFIALFLIIELQFISSLGILVTTFPRNSLPKFFIYLIINILGTIFFLLGLYFIYSNQQSFTFSFSPIKLDKISPFLPLGLLLKIVGAVTPTLFQKFYSKSFIQLYSIFLILSEVAICLTITKLFTKILVVEISILPSLTLINISLICFLIAGLRSKNLINIIIYTSIHNGAIFMIPVISSSNYSVTINIITYLTVYFLTTSFFIKIIQLKITSVQIGLIFLTIISLAGLPPVFGFYTKFLVLSALASAQFFGLFTTIAVSNFISFFVYGRLLIQSLKVAQKRLKAQNKFFKLYGIILVCILCAALILSCLLLNGVVYFCSEIYSYLINPIGIVYHTIRVNFVKAISIIF